MKRKIEEVEEEPFEEEKIKLSKAEKLNLNQFCSLCLKSKTLNEKTRDTLKDSKEALKLVRDKLQELMKNHEVLLIPIDFRRVKNKELAAEGKPELPPYIRMIKNNKDTTITLELLKEIFENLSTDDILESKKALGADAIHEVFMQHIRRNIRSYSEQIRLVHSVPRNMKAADIDIANSEQIQAACELNDILQTILETENGKREILTEIKEQIKQKQPEIESFFNKANINSQRIILENSSYNLVRRINVTKPKLNIKKIETILDETLNEIIRQKSISPITKEKLVDLNNFNDLKESLQKLIESKIISIPSTTRTDIHLKRINHQNQNK